MTTGIALGVGVEMGVWECVELGVGNVVGEGASRFVALGSMISVSVLVDL